MFKARKSRGTGIANELKGDRLERFDFDFRKKTSIKTRFNDFFLGFELIKYEEPRELKAYASKNLNKLLGLKNTNINMDGIFSKY
jgi:hypothetical protein